MPNTSPTFTAASGWLQRPGPLRFHPDSDLGDFSLIFMADGATGDLELEYDGTPGITDIDTLVSLDGGVTYVTFSVSSAGTVSPDMNNNFFKNFTEFDETNPPDYVVIEVGGVEYFFLNEYPTVEGEMTGNDFVIDDGGSVFVCFTRGTSILTDTGPRLIEDLKVGDKVVSRDRGMVPIRWIGSHRIATKPDTTPVRIKAGALGTNQPERDLKVSPMHRVMMKSEKAQLLFDTHEVLVAAKHLVNGETITQDREEAFVEYFHILFDQHEIVYSEGLPTESFHPGLWGLTKFDEEVRAEIFKLFPELATEPASYGQSARPSLKAHEAKLLAAE